MECVGKHGQGAHEAVATAEEEFQKNVSLKSLKSFVGRLVDSMGHLENFIEEMVYFHSRESHLFKQHMQLALEESSGQLKFEV